MGATLVPQILARSPPTVKAISAERPERAFSLALQHSRTHTSSTALPAGTADRQLKPTRGPNAQPHLYLLRPRGSALRPRGFAMAYNDRGVAYVQKGETAQAAADFAKVLELSSDPQLRQKAEEQLKALGVR